MFSTFLVYTFFQNLCFMCYIATKQPVLQWEFTEVSWESQNDIIMGRYQKAKLSISKNLPAY